MTVVDWEKAVPLGLMVYCQFTTGSMYLAKMTVNEVLPLTVFDMLLKELMDVYCTPTAQRISCFVHQRDTLWQTAFERKGFIKNGGYETMQGDAYDQFTYFR